MIRSTRITEDKDHADTRVIIAAALAAHEAIFGVINKNHPRDHLHIVNLHANIVARLNGALIGAAGQAEETLGEDFTDLQKHVYGTLVDACDDAIAKTGTKS